MFMLENAANIASIVESCFAVAGVIIALFGFIVPLQKERKQKEEDQKQYTEELIRQKRRDTIEAVLTLQREALDPLIHYSVKEVEQLAKTAPIYRTEAQKAQYIELKKCLVKCNQFAIIHTQGVYDPEVSLNIIRSGLLSAYSKLKPVIQETRDPSWLPEELKKNTEPKKYYEEFEKFVSEISKGHEMTDAE